MNKFYCAGCNVCFTERNSSCVCPRCGNTLPELQQDLLNETLLIRDREPDRILTDPECIEDQGLSQLIGREILDYRFESLLGQGGMGYVFLVHHLKLHRKSALKILSPQLMKQQQDYVRRFRQEGCDTAALNHPNVVTLHASGETDGFHYLEMEFVAGRSLQKLITHQGRLHAVRATVLATQIAAGLSAAHRAGIIHRDLKPDNILLTHQGIPKIVDFGLAKRVVTQDRQEVFAGTPNFMAPELLQGESANTTTDVYALGICYYYMLTGELPFTVDAILFDEDLHRTAQRILDEPLPSVRRNNPQVTLEMAECLSCLLAKTPTNRPRDAIEAMQLLQAVLGSIRDVETLLIEAFAGDQSVRWSQCDGRYELQVELPDARRQRLYIETSDHRTHERLLMIYSVCCPAEPGYYEQALRLNAEISHGGFALKEVDGELKFVMMDTYPRATVDVDEVRKSVLEVAYRADEFEMRLTGQDLH